MVSDQSTEVFAMKDLHWKKAFNVHLTKHTDESLFHFNICDICGVTGKRRTSDLNVTDARPPLVTIHIRCKLLVNSPNKFNLLLWLLIYLCNKKFIAPNILYVSHKDLRCTLTEHLQLHNIMNVHSSMMFVA